MNNDNSVNLVVSDQSGPASIDAVTQEKLGDLMTPGHVAEFSPDEADIAGVFVEDALNESDAFGSIIDLEPGVED